VILPFLLYFVLFQQKHPLCRQKDRQSFGKVKTKREKMLGNFLESPADKSFVVTFITKKLFAINERKLNYNTRCLSSVVETKRENAGKFLRVTCR
jgi:hypothetical protein